MPLLQEQRLEHRGRATLVLDLDHTLVHGEVKRPGLEEFLEQMSALYEVVLFTAAPREMVQHVVDKIDRGRFAFRLFGDSCVASAPGVHHKILKNLGRNMSKVVVVDDTPSTYKYNQENSLPITPFFRGGEATDQELLGLIPFLASIAQVDDLRLELCKRKGYSTNTTSSASANKSCFLGGTKERESKSKSFTSKKNSKRQ